MRMLAQFSRLALAKGLDLGSSVGEAVIPVLVGDDVQAIAISSNLQRRQVNVQPIIYPAVAHGTARLQFFISSEHAPEDIEFALSCLAEEWHRIRNTGAKRLLVGLNEQL